MTSEIPDFDAKLNLVIGNLLSKADPVSKSVISAYDSSKDLNVNRGVLGGSRFTATALDTCAQFLNIKMLDHDDTRIFTNKPSLANRIILEIQSLFPAICADCDQEYSVEFDSEEAEPVLRCYLCFQGCHDCSAFDPPESSVSFPSGTVWLCRTCHSINNPIKRKKSKSKTASKVNSCANSGRTTPIVEHSSHVNFSQELSEKLSNVSNQQQEQQASNTDNKKAGINSNASSDICDKFRTGKCPHGISGKTIHEGHPCSKLHPKWCYRFARNGRHRKYGCKKGDKCTLFHPKHCPSSVADKTCFSADCTLVHLVGTKRQNSSSDEDQATGSYRRPPGTNSRMSSDSRRKPPAPSRQRNIPSKKDADPPTETLKDIGNFLEIRSLLTTFQETFQKEIQDLKSSLANQESKLAMMMPSFSQHVIKQVLPHPQSGHMPQIFHPPPPFHQYQPPPPFQQPPLPQTMNWQQFPVSGC